MQKRLFVILGFLFVSNMLMAQAQELTVEGAAPDLHVLHTVAPKENWYSVGRLFNISPKEIAPYNGLTMDRPLNIGQQLKIPLSGNNFSQNGVKGADEVLLPVYHTVQDKEWMFRISTNYNKVPVENLEKWNNISRDQAKAGMKLIVGFLKVKKEQAPLAGGGTSQVSTVPQATTPAPVVKTEERRAEPVAKAEPKTDNTPAPPAEEKKLVVNKTVPASESATSAAGSGNMAAGGYFKGMYDDNGKSAGGSAGIFKSVSGWQDGKYYALMNNVAVGTIIKVTNPANNKMVYAKVLSQMPDMKESAGLTIRLSDAAAAALSAAAPKFPIEIRY